MEEKRNIGVYICQCGSNISDYVDVEKVREEVAKINHVSISKTTMFACADATQNEIVHDIQENNLDKLYMIYRKTISMQLLWHHALLSFIWILSRMWLRGQV